MKFNVIKPAHILSICSPYIIIIIILPFAIFLFFRDFIVIGTAAACITFCLIAIPIVRRVHLLTRKKIVITEQGVEYLAPAIHHQMSWDDVEKIGIINNSAGRSSLIFITSDYSSEINYKSAQLSETLFKIGYRKNVEDEIKKYWFKPIDEWSKK